MVAAVEEEEGMNAFAPLSPSRRIMVRGLCQMAKIEY
jgi:hypothetical protein